MKKIKLAAEAIIRGEMQKMVSESQSWVNPYLEFLKTMNSNIFLTTVGTK